jgi:hypothetical protein
MPGLGKSKSRFAILTIAFLTVMASAGAANVGAQICPGSNLFYVVRDAKGAILDTGRSELKYEGDGTPQTYTHWASEAINADRLRSREVPAEISKLDGKVVLKNQAMCTFKDEVNLRVVLAGKTMSLVFHMPKLSEVDSKDFVVDSLPFKPGAYEITLNVPPNTWLNYYPASGWKKSAAKP